MADIFNRQSLDIQKPVTADKCVILWDDTVVSQAFQFQMTYNQGITRRRSIGNQSAVIYGSQPMGQINMARLLTVDASNLFSTKAWTGCGDSESKIAFQLFDCADQSGDTYIAIGCIVTSFSLNANSDDLTVMDNVVVEFLELQRG